MKAREPGGLTAKHVNEDIGVPIDIEDVIEKAFEQAFLRALEQTIQDKAEAVFKKAMGNGSPLAKRLEEKIEEGLDRLFREGIRWEKKKPGFKK